jgi:4-hydroxy-3-polyprenylbenzoate decarboxylase
MGLDPAIYIGACFEAPTTPFGYNELGVAGALRQQPVELVQGVAVKESTRGRRSSSRANCCRACA